MAVSCVNAEDRRLRAERQVRILYIVTAFPRWPGDVITPWLTETIDQLRGRGVEVEVLAPAYRGMPSGEWCGTPVHRFRYAPAALETLTHDQTTPDRIRERPWLASLLPGYVAAGSAAAARLARTGRFDALHAFWPIPHGLLGMAGRRLSGVPLVSTFFGVELTWLRRQFPFLAPIARQIIRRSDAVTVISSHTAREVRRLVPEARVRTIPFGAAVSSGPRDDGPPSAIETIPVARPFNLLFIGRLVERKGVTFLLRAVATIRDRGGDVRLRVVGDGPLREPLQREARDLGIAEAVAFTGFIPSDDLAGALDDCDVFVLPAIQDRKGDVEGLGVVLIEALMRDRPVIASDSGGISDIVIDGESGLLVPPGDVGALASAIERLRDDHRLRTALTIRGRIHAEERFSWERIVDDLQGLYAELRPPSRASDD